MNVKPKVAVYNRGTPRGPSSGFSGSSSGGASCARFAKQKCAHVRGKAKGYCERREKSFCAEFPRVAMPAGRQGFAGRDALGGGGKAVIRNIVGRLHVGADAAEVEAYVKSRFKPGADPTFIRQALKYAAKVHADNRREYTRVMRGGF